jgi:YidC/Oxa1 family membrane protein insertase
MPTFGPVDAAAGVLYTLLTHVAEALRPIDGGAAAAITIVLFTAVVRLLLVPLSRGRVAPPVAALLQAPIFIVLYTVVTRTTVGGHTNQLLAANLFGYALGASGLAAGWPLLAVLVGIAVVATISAWRVRATGQPAWLMLMPYLTLVPAMLMPLAAGFYLLTTAAWSALEPLVLGPAAVTPAAASVRLAAASGAPAALRRDPP